MTMRGNITEVDQVDRVNVMKKGENGEQSCLSGRTGSHGWALGQGWALLGSKYQMKSNQTKAELISLRGQQAREPEANVERGVVPISNL